MRDEGRGVDDEANRREGKYEKLLTERWEVRETSKRRRVKRARSKDERRKLFFELGPGF